MSSRLEENKKGRPSRCDPPDASPRRSWQTPAFACVSPAGLRACERFSFSLIFYWPRLPNPDGSVPCYGFRVSLTAAGQPRILTGFPLMRQSAHQQQRQHMMWFMMVSTQNIVGDVEIHY